MINSNFDIIRLLRLVLLLSSSWIILVASSQTNDECGLPIEENGIYSLSSLNEIQDVMDSTAVPEEYHQALVALILLYEPSCLHTQEMTLQFIEAGRLMTEYFAHSQDTLDRFSKPIFAKLAIDGLTQDEIDRVGVTTTPSLLIVRSNSRGSSFILEYSGKKSTAQNIFKTYLHYYYRLVVTSGDVRFNNTSVNVYPRLFLDVRELRAFIQSHGNYFQESSRNVHTPLPPSMSAEEQQYVRWLLEEESADEGAAGEGFIVFAQCRNSPEPSLDLYDTFDTMSQVLTNRRDRLFAAVQTCNETDGTVFGWHIPLEHLNSHVNWDKETPHCLFRVDNENYRTGSQRLVQFLVQMSTPSVLWFDRQATAPIAFPRYRTTHASIFVDFHHIPPISELGADPKSNTMRQAVQNFRSRCRYFRATRCPTSDMVCLIIPSTETRIMTTFGIDVWTSLDEEITLHLKHEPLLPCILITNQTSEGTMRYYLHGSEITRSKKSILHFFDNFWSNSLHPSIQSDRRGPRITNSGIHILTADSIQQKFVRNQTEGSHALLLFTSPTCGHCKRFHVIWKRLSLLLRKIGWSEQLQLFQIDVSSNDLSAFKITVRWVPDLYYAPPNRQELIRYNNTDTMGDDVGRINTPIDIMAWFLKVGRLNRFDLEGLIDRLENHT